MLAAPACGEPKDSPDASDSTGAETTTAGTTTSPPNTTEPDPSGPSTSGPPPPPPPPPPGSTGEATDDGVMPPIFDLGVPDSPPEPKPEVEPWLLHLGLVGGNRHLFQVDIETAVATDVCPLVDAATMLPITGGTASVTFTRDDRLLYSTGGTLWEIELPSCLATQIGSIGFSGVFGICPDEGDQLYGISANADVLIRINPDTGAGTLIGPLGDNWSMLGGTWNETEQQILGINSSTDTLYEIDSVTGMATPIQVLPLDYQNVGMEFHPLNGQIYSCTSNGHLYRHENDGTLTDLGDMGLESSCTNLGAPWSEEIPLPDPPE